MNKKRAGQKNTKKERERRNKITLIEVFIIFAILAILGNAIYQLMHWREAFEGFKGLGLFGSIAVFAAAIIIRKWIDSL